MRMREAKVGTHVAHHRSGKYLGVITHVGQYVVRVSDPRTGEALTIATPAELVKAPAPS